jgi:hypothetical protein
MEQILDFNVFKYILNKKIKKNIEDILNLTDNYLDIYKKFRRESDIIKKKEYRQKAYEYMKLIHNLFSDIENLLREYKEKAQSYDTELKNEDIPEFDDYIEMTEKEYNKFKKENDLDEQRMLVWLELFKKKIKYLTDIISSDIDNNINVDNKIKLINQFYRQIFVAYKVILNDAFMIGASENKIKIKKG